MPRKRPPLEEPPSHNLAIVYKPIADLIPYARNARTHSDEQIAAIAASLARFGWTNPVLVDGEAILAGHGRVLAAPLVWETGAEIKRTMRDQVPTIDLSDLTPAEKRAYVLADNQLALRAGWDDSLLRSEIADLKAIKFDLSLLGFDGLELSGLLLPKEEGDTDPSQEWTGMPEFNQDDKRAFRQIVVSFANQDDVDTFAALVAQKITDKTKYLWYPHMEIGAYKGKSYE